MKLTKQQLKKVIKEEKQKLLLERMESDVYKVVVRSLYQNGPMSHEALMQPILNAFPMLSDEEIDQWIDALEDAGEITYNPTTQRYH